MVYTLKFFIKYTHCVYSDTHSAWVILRISECTLLKTVFFTLILNVSIFMTFLEHLLRCFMAKKNFSSLLFSPFLRGIKVCVLRTKVKGLFGSPHYEGLISKNYPLKNTSTTHFLWSGFYTEVTQTLRPKKNIIKVSLLLSLLLLLVLFWQKSYLTKGFWLCMESSKELYLVPFW